jgi:hypothetical protein
MSKTSLQQSLQELSVIEFASSKENAKVAIVQKLRANNLEKLVTQLTASIDLEKAPLWDLLDSECIAPQSLVAYFKFALAQDVALATKYAIAKV